MIAGYPRGLRQLLLRPGTPFTDIDASPCAGTDSRDLSIIAPVGAKLRGYNVLLQIYFKVNEENGQAFEDMFRDVYVPAMQVQEGYLGSRLLRLFPKEVHEEINARPTEFNYQMNLVFDTEENRRKWAASDEHQVAFPKAKELAEDVQWRGFDVAVEDG